jgi:DNA invertase Pin-like site-specific DNA recombinase
MGRVQGDDLVSDAIQRERIEAWAQFQGAQIVGWYEDIDRSGRKGKPRPEFARLMEDARAGAVDAIAVYRWSRLGRHAAGALAILDELDELGVRLVSVEENIDTSTPMGRFIRLVLVGLAEYQSEGISEEWKAKYAADRRAGIALKQRRTLGYRTDGARIAGVHPQEAEAVRSIFGWYVEGAGKTGIARRLDAEGYRPVRGERFTASTVDTVLRNPTYCALIRYTDEDGRVEESEAVHEPIVSRALFERAQRELRRRATAPPPRAKAGLLSGLLRCAGCGHPMNHDRRGDVAYYRCAARNRSDTCTLNTSVRADYIDEWAWGEFERMVAVLFLSGERNVVGEPVDAKSAAAAERAEACRVRAADLEAKLDQLTERSDVLGSQYERQAARLVGQIEEALADADGYEARVQRRTARPWQALEGWTPAVDLPLAERQRVLRLLVERVQLDRAPRKGAGQRALIPERARIEWAEDVTDDVNPAVVELIDFARGLPGGAELDLAALRELAGEQREEDRLRLLTGYLSEHDDELTMRVSVAPRAG